MNKKVLVAFAASVLSAGMSAQSVYPGQHHGKMKIETVAPVSVASFDLKDVRLLPSRFRDNMLRDSAWMVSLDVNRLLHSFRTNAGVFAGREGGYMTVKKLGGWESLDCELRGHTTGHLLSAFGLMYAATGSEIFKLKGDSLVNGLEEVQKALKGGYLSAYPEELIHRNMQGKGVWAPWYTLHKLFSGLIDQYLYADNRTALEVVTRMGDWAYNKLKPLSEETRRLMIRNEFGGVNESFYNLYAITGEERYQWLAEYFYHNDVIDPLKEQRDDLGTKHTNTFIPKVLAEARHYELTQNETSRKLSEYFWHAMIDHHTYAPGCSSDKEHFFDPKKFSQHLTGYTGETCCTYNMLKLSRHLFCWTGDSSIADYYERALYNHILGQQDPETGMVAYFLPLLSGSHKLYSTKENSFWCCVGSGFENHAKYGEAIYYHNDQGIYVNLFIPSQVNWREKGLTLSQETNFPANETTQLSIRVDKPVRTTVYLRYPSWSQNVKVLVNGKKVSIQQKPGTYIAITREWKDGDRIAATYPMRIQLEATPDNPQKAALLYGPLVLAGERGTEGMQASAPFSNPALYNDYYTYNYQVPASLSTSLKIDMKHPERALKRVGEELLFTTGQGDVIRPLYDLHRQRYVVYWDLTTE
ncbi:glycoside hydrolase family 127 protein [Bacteroides reticulotermitis]|uniref:glycoside hydrolase family 127 protein n=1 Tax=Bacteroides reticulotermitis TaxID=1133319 RepID=UPI003A89B950